MQCGEVPPALATSPLDVKCKSRNYRLLFCLPASSSSSFPISMNFIETRANKINRGKIEFLLGALNELARLLLLISDPAKDSSLWQLSLVRQRAFSIFLRPLLLWGRSAVVPANIRHCPPTQVLLLPRLVSPQVSVRTRRGGTRSRSSF